MGVVFIVKNNDMKVMDDSSIKIDGLQIVDKPYRLQIVKNNPPEIKLVTMFDKEGKIEIDIAESTILYGSISGIIYYYKSKVQIGQTGFVFPEKFCNKIPNGRTERFKNNFKYGLAILQLYFNKYQN